MDIESPKFWQRAVAVADTERLRSKARHLECCTIGLDIDGQRHVIEFHKGSVFLRPAPDPRGTRFQVLGPRGEWQRLLDGTIHYMRAINGLHGKLKVEGDFLAATWAGPALCELMSAAVSVNRKAQDNG